MELAQEEFMGSNDLTQIIKGKRTKRQRSSSPPHKAGMVSSGSSSGCGHDDDGGGEEYGSISSHTSCSEVYHERTEEEEDMANCLILLAQGGGPRLKNTTFLDENNSRIEKFSSRKFSQVSTTSTTNKAGFYVYECKTCNRSFPSFQALGGHRASHKKPKPEEKKVLVVAAPPPPPSILMHDDDGHDNLDDCQLNKSSTSSPDPPPPLALQISNINNKIHSKAKIHECSICGSEFTSGQALGGHMRRHRANTTVNNNQVVAISGDDQIKPRTILSLDLNLPAPEDDHHHRESKFQFVSTPQALVFSAAPALVDCHY